MARVTTPIRLQALEQTITDLQELLQTSVTNLNDSGQKVKVGIQATLRRAITTLRSENERLRGQIDELQTTIADQKKDVEGLRDRLLAETKKQGRTQLILGVVFTLVGAVIGWLLGAVGNPVQAFSLLFLNHP